MPGGAEPVEGWGLMVCPEGAEERVEGGVATASYEVSSIGA